MVILQVVKLVKRMFLSMLIWVRTVIIIEL